MIVYERAEDFIMITQHDHANVSGQLAQGWREEHFFGLERKKDVLFAAYEHDRGWIDLDTAPFLNDRSGAPYSFIDFPAIPKLTFYKKGIEEVEEKNGYAALLCSLHYDALLGKGNHPSIRQFQAKERERQNQLKCVLELFDNSEKNKQLQYHLNMLQLCDNISLYICLNEPGVAKSNEYPYFREGFQQTFPFTNGNKIIAQWTDQETVSLTHSPLKEHMYVSLNVKAVKKQALKEIGLINAYEETPFTKRCITFV